MKQEKSIQSITSTAVDIATAECPLLLPKAQQLQKKHTSLWSKFALCHADYNDAKTFSDEDVAKLGK